MIITKEHQESWVNSYIKDKHTTDECIGFIDGINKALDYISNQQPDKMVKVSDVVKYIEANSNINDNGYKSVEYYDLKQYLNELE